MSVIIVVGLLGKYASASNTIEIDSYSCILILTEYNESPLEQLAKNSDKSASWIKSGRDLFDTAINNSDTSDDNDVDLKLESLQGTETNVRAECQKIAIHSPSR